MGGRPTLVSFRVAKQKQIRIRLTFTDSRGAWQERQVCDRDPLAFTEPGNFNSREKQELCLPLLFYSFACLNFFLTIPRSWTPIQLQRSPDQLLSQALPTATDARFKAAAITAIAGVLVICYSLEHSIYRYIARPADRIRMRTFYLVSAPSQFVVAIAILSVKVGYGIASAFAWTVSPLNANVNPAWLYGLGYTPILLIIMLFNLCGLCDLNEDKTLLLLRGDRVAPKKCKLERKLPVWLNSGRWEIFKHSTRSKRDDGDGDDVERFVEMGIIKPEDEPKGVAGGSDISTTADPDPFSDTAGFSIDIDDIVGRLERDDEGRVHESTSETMIDETQTMRNMLV